MTEKPQTVDQYLASLPADTAARMTSIREAVLASLPAAGEKLSYGMPAVTVDGRTVLSYGAWKKHIGVYPIPAGDAAFESRMAAYRDAKSTARFPYSEDLPVDLIIEMARLNAAR